MSIKPTAPWSVSFADGNNNQFIFEQANLEEEAHFTYRPVTPIQSSSGSYSGGSPNKGTMTPDQSRALWEWVQRIASAKEDHLVDQRPMGSGQLQFRSGKEAQTIVFLGDTLSAFDAFLEGFR